MRDYAVVANIKVKQKCIIDDVFDKGYEQGYQDGKEEREKEYKEALHNIENTYIKGQKAEYDRGYKEGKEAAEDDMYKYYNKHFNDVVNSSNDDAYQRGYEDGKKSNMNDAYEVGFNQGKKTAKEYNEQKAMDEFNKGYQKGLQHGQELRAKEAECAEACGMKRAWNVARKLLSRHGEGYDATDMEVFGTDDVFSLSASEAVAKLDEWEKKQTEKNCENCKYNNREKTSYPCAACLRKIDGRHAMWEEKEDYVRVPTPEESKSVNDYIKSISEETGVIFNEKEEQTTTLCRKCIHAHNMHDNILTCDAVPCVIEDGHCDKYEEKQEQTEPEKPSETINNDVKVGDLIRTLKDKNSYGIEVAPIGSIGRITAFEDKLNLAPYRIRIGDYYHNYSSDMFEIMNDDNTKSKYNYKDNAHDYISREDVLNALTGDITDCTIEDYIRKLREKICKL